ncbi:MAG: hypothetical protein OHK0037_07930 [Elainellaceae cyanobacterium]
MKIMTKRSVYPAAIGLVLLGLTVWFLSQFQIDIQFEGTPSAVDPSSIEDEPNTSPAPSPTPLVSPTSPAPIASPIGSPAASPAAVPAAPDSPQPATVQAGSLRVSNQTDHPVRVALLSRSSENSRSGGSGEPVHWDFAPQEGSTKGLLLALPEGEADLQVRTGDVITAFAQDGSRRYWGPYVVGETVYPTWNAASSEWELVFAK